MVPSPASEELTSHDLIVVAAFRREELVRLHSLLAAYESPYTTPGEVAERAADLRAHESLQRHIAALLQDE